MLKVDVVDIRLCYNQQKKKKGKGNRMKIVLFFSFFFCSDSKSDNDVAPKKTNDFVAFPTNFVVDVNHFVLVLKLSDDCLT